MWVALLFAFMSGFLCALAAPLWARSTDARDFRIAGALQLSGIGCFVTAMMVIRP